MTYRLGGDVIAGRETGLAAKKLVQTIDLAAIVVEDLQEGSVSTSRTLSTTEPKLLADMLNVLEVHHQSLSPLSGTFSDSNQLGLLQSKVSHLLFEGLKSSDWGHSEPFQWSVASDRPLGSSRVGSDIRKRLYEMLTG
jgi:hypothetical protein